MAGLSFGFAGYLAHAAGSGWVDISWIPGRLLESVWLLGNAFLAMGFGALALRSRAVGLER
jgi:hypothetical protein